MGSRHILHVCFVLFDLASLLLCIAPPRLFPFFGQGFAIPDPQHPDVRGTAPARRVIIFPPLLTSYAVLKEGVSNIVGASASAVEIPAKGPLGRVYPPLTRINVVTTWPKGTTYPTDPEQILLLQPDAVFVWQGTGTALQQSGLPVLEISSLVSDHGAVAAWNLIAAVTMRQVRGAWLHQHYEEADQETYHEVTRTIRTRKPTTLVIWRTDSRIFSLGQSTFPPAKELERLGAVNLASSNGLSNINVEQLLALDPDIIFLSSIGPIDEVPQTFYDDPLVQSLTAVRCRRIYKLPIIGSRMEGLVPDHALFLRWAAELLYPDQMSKQLRGLFKSTYHDVYNYQVTDDEIDEALFTRENKASIGAERFDPEAYTIP